MLPPSLPSLSLCDRDNPLPGRRLGVLLPLVDLTLPPLPPSLPPSFLFHLAIETTPSLEEDSESYYHLLMTRVDEALLLPPEGRRKREGGREGIVLLLPLTHDARGRRVIVAPRRYGKREGGREGGKEGVCLPEHTTDSEKEGHVGRERHSFIPFSHTQTEKKRANGKTTKPDASQKWSCGTCLGRATVGRGGREGPKDGKRTRRTHNAFQNSFIGKHWDKSSYVLSFFLAGVSPLQA